MEFDGELIRFNIFKTMRYPSDVHFVFAIDEINTLVQDFFELSGNEGVDHLFNGVGQLVLCKF